MKTYNYSVSTNTIWTSFDYGTVQADSKEEALEIAKKELTENFKKANSVLEKNEETKWFNIHFAIGQIQIDETL